MFVYYRGKPTVTFSNFDSHMNDSNEVDGKVVNDWNQNVYQLSARSRTKVSFQMRNYPEIGSWQKGRVKAVKTFVWVVAHLSPKNNLVLNMFCCKIDMCARKVIKVLFFNFRGVAHAINVIRRGGLCVLYVLWLRFRITTMPLLLPMLLLQIFFAKSLCNRNARWNRHRPSSSSPETSRWIPANWWTQFLYENREKYCDDNSFLRNQIPNIHSWSFTCRRPWRLAKRQYVQYFTVERGFHEI